MKTDPYLINPTQKIRLHGTSFPLEYLYRGMLVTGAPGSGKTRCVLIPLLKQILQEGGTKTEVKPGMIIIDPKNELVGLIKPILEQAGRLEDLLVLKSRELGYNPLSNPFLSQVECVEKLISFASNRNRNTYQRPRGDELFWASAMRSLLNAVITLSVLREPKLSFPMLNDTLISLGRCNDLGEAKAWFRKLQIKPDTSTLSEISDFLSLPPSSTRPCVYSSASNVLSFWNHEPLKSLVEPPPGTPMLDPIDIVHLGKILVVGCSSAAYGGSISPFLLALKEHLFTALLSRDQIEVEENGAWTSINQKRPFFIVADEFQAYLSPDSSVGELVALDRLRGFNAGMIAATQNLASLHSVLGDETHGTRLVSLFANQLFLSNLCPYTAKQAANVLDIGDRTPLPPPLLPALRDGCHMPPKCFNKENSTYELSKLKTGEYWGRYADGRIERRQAMKGHKSLK